MKFRISMKNEKHDSSTKPVQISVPHKDAIAIEAPKKVIKALYDYTAPADSNLYLSFSAGDFLHVVSREHDQDWYEACNPLRNERGLVPVNHFQDIGKTVRDSGDSNQSGSATHDSGYAENHPSQSQHSVTSAPRMSAANGGMIGMSNHRPSKSLGKNAAGVYGIVAFDFKAERPDELEATAGEPIIVIAQSNPEWFVAKPITRLGGPGLIPVSFIEVRDMLTGKPAEDALAAVQAAGIPRVEEWKKMAAEYKNTSIPLGTVSSSQSMQSLQQGVDRMSLNTAQQAPYAHQRHQSHSFQSQQQQGLFAPERASVPRYTYTDDKFHFIVECRLTNGTHWDLSRVYEDFYELQINLIHAFPEEAGQIPGRQRKLPYMPGPVKYVTDNLTEGRRANLDEYLRELLKLDSHITTSSLVRAFFAPRDNSDYEIDTNNVDVDKHARAAEVQQPRYSQTSQTSYGTASQYRHPSSSSANLASSSSSSAHHQYPPPQGSNINAYGHQRAQQSQASASYSSLPQPQQHSSQASQPPMTLGQLQGTAPVKIKCWFDRNTCVVIRLPPAGQFDFNMLWAKCIERRRLEFKDRPMDQQEEEESRLDMEYRDERTGEYYRIEGDQDLICALEHHRERLTIALRDRTFEGE